MIRMTPPKINSLSGVTWGGKQSWPSGGDFIFDSFLLGTVRQGFFGPLERLPQRHLPLSVSLSPCPLSVSNLLQHGSVDCHAPQPESLSTDGSLRSQRSRSQLEAHPVGRSRHPLSVMVHCHCCSMMQSASWFDPTLNGYLLPRTCLDSRGGRCPLSGAPSTHSGRSFSLRHKQRSFFVRMVLCLLLKGGKLSQDRTLSCDSFLIASGMIKMQSRFKVV